MVRLKILSNWLILSLFLVLTTSFLSYLFLRDNIHTISPGILYRSAQLSSAHLQRFVRSHHIRTIINLRGEWDDDDWYLDEVLVSQSMGIEHYDIQLHANKLPTTQQLQFLLALYQKAPKPILLHCEGGADRTGFAVAMWLLMHGHSLNEAWRAVSIWYFVVKHDSIGRQVLPLYEKWLKRHHYQTSSAHFMEWARSTQLGSAP